MPGQLDLLPPPRDVDEPWVIDEETRLVGRRGLAKARAALDAARSRLDQAA